MLFIVCYSFEPNIICKILWKIADKSLWKFSVQSYFLSTVYERIHDSAEKKLKRNKLIIFFYKLLRKLFKIVWNHWKEAFSEPKEINVSQCRDFSKTPQNTKIFRRWFVDFSELYSLHTCDVLVEKVRVEGDHLVQAQQFIDLPRGGAPENWFFVK
jgi:hypothetical protein